jgi:hypothetical protein
MVTTIESWLTERVSVEQVEAAAIAKADQPAGNAKVPSKPFGQNNQRWERLKAQMASNDELWYFCSPEEMWRNLAGRAGIALVRNGKVIDELIFLMN